MSNRAVPVLVAAVALATPVLSGCLLGSVPVGTEEAVTGADAIVDVAVTDVTGSSATVRFVVTGDPADVTVLYGRNLSALRPGPDPRTVEGGYEAGLRGLAPNTSYVAVAEAALDGARLRSAPVSFTTAHKIETAEMRIRPGIAYYLDRAATSWCTLGFILESTTNASVYAVTAGHCLDSLEANGTLYLEDGTPFADVAAHVYESDGETLIDLGWATTNTSDWIDWGMMKIRPEMVPHVSAKVTHWTGPTALSGEGALAEGDTICYYGHRAIPRYIQKHRCASFWMYDEDTEENQHDEVRSWIVGSGAPDGEPVVVDYGYPGDSGAPVVDYRTGEAVGIHTHTDLSHAFNEATALYGVLDILEGRGYDVELATANWDPPPANPIPVGPLP